jgi:hypothetical protein
VIINRNAWVAVDATGAPLAIWPGREGARRRATQWIREQDRDDLRAVPLSKMREQPSASTGG